MNILNEYPRSDSPDFPNSAVVQEGGAVNQGHSSRPPAQVLRFIDSTVMNGLSGLGDDSEEHKSGNGRAGA